MSDKVTSFHAGLSVRGALGWPRRQLGRLAKSMNLTADDLRELLMDELSQGHEIIPLGPCDNWDWKTGCKGHAGGGEPPAEEGK